MVQEQKKFEKCDFLDTVVAENLKFGKVARTVSKQFESLKGEMCETNTFLKCSILRLI